MSHSNNKPPIWYWLVSLIALVWNGMGVNAYLQQAYDTESYRAMYSEEQLEIAAGLPAFVTAAFAIAVFGGLTASVLLLFRNKLASFVFLVSLLAVLVQTGYLLINGYVSNLVMTILIVVFAVVMLWFSRMAKAKSWLN